MLVDVGHVVMDTVGCVVLVDVGHVVMDTVGCVVLVDVGHVVMDTVGCVSGCGSCCHGHRVVLC